MATDLTSVAIKDGFAQLLHCDGGLSSTETAVLDGDGTSSTLSLGTTSATIAGNLVISGNLTISGTTTSVNTQTLNVADNIVVLNNDVTGTPSQNAGIEIERGTSTNTVMRWNESTDRWQFTNDGTTYYNIPITSELGSSTFRTVTAGGNTLDVDETLAFTAGSNIAISESNGAVTIAATDTNTFRTITAGGNTLGSSETLAFVAGSNVTISESGGSVTIASASGTDTVDMGDGFKLVDADSNNDVTEGHYVKFVTQQGSGGVGVVTGAGSSGDPHLVTLNYADTNTTYSVMGSGNSYAAGLVLAGASSHNNTYLRKDGTWTLPSIHIQDDDGDSLTVDIDEHIKITGTGGITTDWTTDDAGGSGAPNILTIGVGNITNVGTVTSGVWNATAIASQYLDADTAHLSGTQTFTGAKTFSAAATMYGLQINAGNGDNSSGQDATLYVSATANNDWGIWVNKASNEYGVKISVASDSSLGLAVYGGTTKKFSVTGNGVIDTGTWNGSVIASAYLDSDTAHLSGTQTFSGAKTFSSTTTFSNTSSYGDLDIIPTSSNRSVIKHDSGSGSLTLRGDQINLQNKGGDATGLVYNDGAGITFPNNVIIGGENATPEVELFYNHSNGSDYKAYLQLGGNDLEIRGSSGTMEFYTGAVDGASSTLAFSINSSQNSTFAGGTTTFPVGGILRFGERGNLTHNSSNYNMTFNTNSLANAMTVTGTGNVLIGTTDDDARLMVKKVDGTSYGQFVTIEGDTTDNNNYSGISFKAGTLANAYPEIGVSNGGLMFQMSGGYHSSNYNNRTKIQLNGSDGHISFQTGGDPATEVGRFDSEGNFGIGASGSNLNARIVRGFSANKGLVIETQQPAIQLVDTDNTGRYFTLAYEQGAKTVYMHNQSNGPIRFDTNGTARMYLTGAGNLAIGGSGGYQKLSVEGGNIYISTGQSITWSNGNATISESGYNLKFATYSGSAVIERMRIESDGDVHCDADVIAFSNTIGSDRRLKKNIADIKYGLDDVLKLRGVEFDWNRKDYAKKHDVGFIAQEVREVIPELVKRTSGLNDKGSFLTVDYAKLVPVLVESIKELKKEIEGLKNGSN